MLKEYWGGDLPPCPPPQVTPMFWIYGMYNMCRYVYIHKQQEELQFCMVLDNMWGNVVFWREWRLAHSSVWQLICEDYLYASGIVRSHAGDLGGRSADNHGCGNGRVWHQAACRVEVARCVHTSCACEHSVYKKCHCHAPAAGYMWLPNYYGWGNLMVTGSIDLRLVKISVGKFIVNKWLR